MVYIIMRTSRDDLSSPIGTTPLRSVKPNMSQKSNSSLILYFLLCFFGRRITGNLMIHTGEPRGEEMILTYLFLTSYIIPPRAQGS